MAPNWERADGLPVEKCVFALSFDGRSEVVITGLRPGEKLYEEKLSDKDKTIPTDNPKVYKAIVNGTLDSEEFERFMQDIYTMEPETLVRILRNLVPEFSYQGAISSDTSR